MTIINPNSISGISSITALNSTAAINLFKADGTSANIIAGVTTGSNFITGTSNVHSTGYECTNINASGIVTAATLDISGDIDFDGQTNLDHVSISGVTTFTGAIDANSTLEVAGIANFDSTLQVAEKIEHLGDTDTYLQFTANTINLHSGGTTGLTVLDASVRVPTKLGINGAAPQVPLDVIANGSGYAINVRGRSSDNIGEIRFTSNDYGSLYGQIVTGPTYLNLKTGGTERLRCDADGVKTLNGRFYSAGTFAYIESSSTSTSTLTLKKSASGADSIDYLQLRDNSNAVKFKISGDGILFTSDVLASHEGDTDTKIRFPSNDQISFETAGSERVRIDDDGNFLIGITGHGNASTYARNLIISGSSNRGLTIHTTDTSGSNRKACIFFGTGTSVADMADGMLFYDNASRYFHMSTAGGGTGVTQSSFRLGSDGTVRFDSTPTTVNSISLRIQSHKTRTVDDNNGIVFFDEVNHSQAAIAVQKKSASNATSDLVFRTSSGQVVGTLQGIPERLRIKSDGSLRTYTDADGVSCFSNNAHGNIDFNHRGSRVLHSNGTGWGSSDGQDPILVLAVENRAGNSDIGNAYGLCLHSESQDNNDYGPMIGWSNRSNSGSYNTTYAAVVGKKTGQGPDSNWSAGELLFYTMPTGGYIDNTPNMSIDSSGRVKTPRQVAFYATANSGGTVSMTSTHVLTNWRLSTSGKTYSIGGHFNTSNGRFTAPVSGTYLFTSSILLSGYSAASGIHMMWRKNGSTYQYWYNTRTSDIDRSGYGGYLAQGSTTTMSLDANDYIEVACNFSGSLSLWCGDSNWGHFSGMLLG